jgi:hypothetical protein
MTKSELEHRLSKIDDPDAEVVFVDVDFNSYYIEDNEDFMCNGNDITIYIAQ